MAFNSKYSPSASKDTNEEDTYDHLEDDDLFIDMVKARPWLYDKSHESYSNSIMVLNGWKDISEAFYDSGKFCLLVLLIF